MPDPAAPAGDGASFYTHLMSMIDETALENRRVEKSREIHVALPAPGHPTADTRRRFSQPMAFAAGLIAAVAVGGVIVAFRVTTSEAPPVVVADFVPGEKPVAVASTATVPEEAEERSLVAAEHDGPAKNKDKDKAVEGGIATGSIAAVKPDAPPATKPPADLPASKPSAEAPVASPAPEPPPPTAVDAGAEATKKDAPAEASPAWKVTSTEAVAPPEDAPSEKAPADAPLPVAPEDNAEAPGKAPIGAPIRVARIISDVRLRAGPSNAQAVIATVPRGASVDVVECRAWCEVIFAGQRGWVYKGFVGPVETAHGD